MEPISVLVLSDLPTLSMDEIASISPRIHAIDARHKFDQEMRESWPQVTVERYLPPPLRGEDTAQDEGRRESTRQERNALLREANVACIDFPYPLDLVSRSPRLKWVHQMAAGASNLRFGDIWGSSVKATTLRGHLMTVPIAEYVVAAMLAFAKELPRALAEKQRRHLERQDYHPLLVQGKTIGILGLGGIGREVARLARALGMRVLATRRSASVRADSTEGVDTLFPPQELDSILEKSDFVALCAQHTPETEGMIGEAQLRAMKPSAYVVNVARGELIDEDALVRALREGWIAGAALDVYAGEFYEAVRDDFLDLPNVILTPHNAGETDAPAYQAPDMFYENLRRFLAGDELLNVVDWERGY